MQPVSQYHFVSAQPVEEDTESEAEEAVVSLPDYDLPTKRGKTKLEEYTVEEKITKKKPKKQTPEEPAEWDKLGQKEPEDQERQPPLTMGKGKRAGIIKSYYQVKKDNQYEQTKLQNTECGVEPKF